MIFLIPNEKISLKNSQKFSVFHLKFNSPWARSENLSQQRNNSFMLKTSNNFRYMLVNASKHPNWCFKSLLLFFLDAFERRGKKVGESKHSCDLFFHIMLHFLCISVSVAAFGRVFSFLCHNFLSVDDRLRILKIIWMDFFPSAEVSLNCEHEPVVLNKRVLWMEYL